MRTSPIRFATRRLTHPPSSIVTISLLGRDTVDFLEHGLSYHVAEELAQNDEGDEVDIKTRLERAFLMADIHARQAGLETSGATVTVCLVKVSALSILTAIDLLSCLKYND